MPPVISDKLDNQDKKDFRDKEVQFITTEGSVRQEDKSTVNGDLPTTKASEHITKIDKVANRRC